VGGPVPRSLALVALAVALVASPQASAAVAAADDPTPRLEATFVEAPLDGALADAVPAGELVLAEKTTSTALEHRRYEQRVDGVPVLDAGASEHRALEQGWTVSHHDLVPADWSTQGTFALDGDQARRLALVALDATVVPGLDAHAERAWHPDEGTLHAAWAVTVPAADPPGEWRVVVDAADETVLATERTQAGPAPDRAGADGPAPGLDAVEVPPPGAGADAGERMDLTATPFQVNPVVAEQDPDRRDNAAGVDDGSFEDAFQTVELEGVREAQRLQTDRVRVLDAATVPVDGTDLDVRRDDPRFDELMVLYYTDRAVEAMEELGYGDLYDYEQVHSVSRVPSPIPNALATEYGGQGYTVFFYRAPAATSGGTATSGFASAAEDGEVVVHELGHLFHFGAAGDASGDWYGAWAEGTADYYASVLLEDESGGYGDPCTAEWFTSYLADGARDVPEHEGAPCLRVLENDLSYPEDLDGTPEDPGSGHYNGQFWSGAHWEIRQQIGREASLVLMTESLHVTPGDLDSVQDLAATTVTADCALTDCARYDTIEAAFADKNISLPEMDLPGLDNRTEEADAGNATDDAGDEEPSSDGNQTGSGANETVTPNERSAGGDEGGDETVAESVPGPGAAAAVAAGLAVAAGARRARGRP